MEDTLPALCDAARELLSENRVLSALPIIKRVIPLGRAAYGEKSHEYVSLVRFLMDSCTRGARNALERKKHEECKSILSFVFSLLPKFVAFEDSWALLHNVKACYYRTRGRLPIALRELQNAAKYVHGGASLATLSINMCAILSQMGRHKRALQHARTAVVVLKNSVEDSSSSSSLTRCTVQENLGLAYFNCGVEFEYCKQPDQAMKMYDRAIEKVESLLLRVSKEEFVGTVDTRSLKSLVRKFQKAKQRLESGGEEEKEEKVEKTTKEEFIEKKKQQYILPQTKTKMKTTSKVRVVFRPGRKKIKKRSRPETATTTEKNRHLKVISETRKKKKDVPVVAVKKKLIPKERQETLESSNKRMKKKNNNNSTGKTSLEKKHQRKVDTKKKNVVEKKSSLEKQQRKVDKKKTKKQQPIRSKEDEKTMTWLRDAGIRDEKVYEQFRKRRTSMFTLLRLKRMYFLKDEEGYSVKTEEKSKKSWVALHEMLLRDFKISKLGDRLRFEVALSRLEDPKQVIKKKKKIIMKNTKNVGVVNNKSSLHPRETHQQQQQQQQQQGRRRDENQEKKMEASRRRKEHKKPIKDDVAKKSPNNKAAFEAIRVAKYASKFANKQANSAVSKLKKCVENNMKNVRTATLIAFEASRNASAFALEASNTAEIAMRRKIRDVSDTADRITMTAASSAKLVVERTTTFLIRVKRSVEIDRKRARRRKEVRTLIHEEASRLMRLREIARQERVRLLEKEKEDENRARENRAASVVQSAVRSHVRRVVQLKNAAACAVQWFVRGRFSERREKEREEREREEKKRDAELAKRAQQAAATVIQTRLRGIRGRKIASKARDEMREKRRQYRERLRLEKQGVQELLEQYSILGSKDPTALPQQSLSFLREAERDKKRQELLLDRRSVMEIASKSTSSMATDHIRTYLKMQRDTDEDTMNRIVAAAMALHGALIATRASEFAIRTIDSLHGVVEMAEKTKQIRERELLSRLKEMHETKQAEIERAQADPMYAERIRLMEIERMRFEDELSAALETELRRKKTLNSDAEKQIAHLGATLMSMGRHTAEAKSTSEMHDAYVESKKKTTSQEIDETLFLAVNEKSGTYERCHVVDLSDLSTKGQRENDGTVSIIFETSMKDVATSDSVLVRIPTKNLRSYHSSLEGQKAKATTKVVVVQASLDDDDRVDNTSTVSRIQALVRGRITRRRLQNDREQRERSSVKIQAIYRGHSSRVQSNKLLLKSMLSAQCIQCAVRSFLQRLRICQDQAATKIQRAARGRYCRVRYGPILKRRSPTYRKRVAATRIQSIYRGFVLRKHSAAQELACIKIQGLTRGVATRARLKRLNIEINAARCIQRNVRPWIRRVIARRVKLKMQRQKAQQQAFEEDTRAASRIQTWFRASREYRRSRIHIKTKSTPSEHKEQHNREFMIRSQDAAQAALHAADFASRKILGLNKSIKAWTKSSRMDLRRRATKKRLLVTMFAEVLEVVSTRNAAAGNDEEDGRKPEENWGTINGVQLRKVVTSSFVSMFFPKHAKAIASMAARLSKQISNRPINCSDFVRAGLDVLSRSG